MPIIEYYSKEEEQEFGCGTTFRVHDDMLIFDRRLAHAINHLYNHIQVLIHLTSSWSPFADTELKFLVESHPALRVQAASLLNELPTQPWDLEKMDTLRLTIVHRLIEETQALTEISASLAWTIEHERDAQTDGIDKSQDASIEKLEQTLARIPFVDFHAVVHERPSIVQVINV